MALPIEEKSTGPTGIGIAAAQQPDGDALTHAGETMSDAGAYEPCIAGADSQSSGAHDAGAARNGLRALGVYGLRLGGAGLTFLAQIALARWLSAAEYGIYASIFVWLTLVGGWLSLGFGVAMIRFIPEYKALERFDLLRGLRRASFGVAIGISVLVAALALALVSSGVVPIAPTYRDTIVFAALMLPFLALIEINDGFCRGQGLPIRAMSPSLVFRPIALLTGVGLAVTALAMPALASSAMKIMLVAVVATAVVQMVVAARSIGGQAHRSVAPRYDLCLWLSVSVPLLFVEGLFALMGNVDMLLVGSLLTSTHAGHYFAATRILVLVGFVPVAVIAVMAPGFSHFAAKGDTASLARTVNQAVALSFWPALALAVGLAAAGPFLLAAFGSSFTEAYPAMLILTLAAVARAALAPAQTMLVITGHHRIGMAILAVALVTNTLLNLIMIPAYGISGAAMATAAAIVLEVAFSAAVIRRRFGFLPSPRIRIDEIRCLVGSRLGGGKAPANACEEVRP